MQTKESNRDKWVSGSLIVGAVLAGLAAVAVQRHGVAAGPVPPVRAPITPEPAGKPAETPPPPQAPPPVAKAPRPRVDIVFALDTTGSMSGLIEGAKRKIWGIASFVARAQPTPDLRVGLVAYRDVGDDYVTRTYDLDGNLDRVYRRLLGLTAAGGGDTPEHVARALTEAVHKMSWARPEDRAARSTANGGERAVRLIYLVGDAPPHTDYQDGYDYARAARDAAQMGIQVHAIRCGLDPTTGTYWQRIASLGHGEFLTIDQDGGMRDTHTPYDEELARLHDELSDTVIPFGAHAAETRASLGAAAAAAPAVKAARAGYVAAKAAPMDDLLEGVSSGKVHLDKVPASELPKGLAGLSEPEREKKVAKDIADREALMSRISKLAGERDAYLRAHAKHEEHGFDGEVEKTVRKAGASAGLSF